MYAFITGVINSDPPDARLTFAQQFKWCNTQSKGIIFVSECWTLSARHINYSELYLEWFILESRVKHLWNNPYFTNFLGTWI